MEDLGELTGPDRDRVVAGSHALVMPGSWPEPFGLTAIEALACGTPVLGRRVGALPEIIREGIDGYFGDDVEQLAFLADRVDGLDRAEIRRSVLERFSAGRMADGYEAVFRRTLARSALEHAQLDLGGRAPVPVVPAAAPEIALTDPHDGRVAPLRAVADHIAQVEAVPARD